MGVFVSRDQLVESYEGELTDRQLTFADTKIIEGEGLLMTLVPELEAGPHALAALVVTNVRTVVCAAVLRVVRNPTGVAYEQIAGITTRLSDEAASGVLEFTEKELATVRAALRGPKRRVGVVGVAAPRWWGV
ncbi:hypothetical protein OG563_26455 [Nocardia vinacea]|uniref:Uncharacterized protein n=1 Tax=Nocardia vinacea TaxID=96468 RepID=A0ABZ1YHU0_9NOCA|nr:hypothetical protein [Nocardia vinacea]